MNGVRPRAEARDGQPHRETVAGEHRHPACVVADQVREAAPNLDRRVPVAGQRHDVAKTARSPSRARPECRKRTRSPARDNEGHESFGW